MLEKLNLERWYRVLVYLGAIFFGGAVFFSDAVNKGPITDVALMLLGAGMFFFGMGEWINHPPRGEKGGPSFFGPGAVRVPHLGGLLLDVVGAALFIAGLGWRWLARLF
ncbi:MAG: hypothetical protein FWC42_11055 [Proteobacteria bacterium]|nr:hypothetical protein [Pseudomonadota bacterium]